jgi:acetyl esterase/lipase
VKVDDGVAEIDGYAELYTPHRVGPVPLLLFSHGSGFVPCSLDTHDGMCRNLCAGAACVVASVDYRLAPERKFPAGINNCLDATRWAATHAAELPALVITAEYDPLREEGEFYAEKLRAAGVAVTSSRYNGINMGSCSRAELSTSRTQR